MRDFLHHFFAPRESNNHRAKLLHHSSLLLTIVLLFSSNFFLNLVQKEMPAVLGVSHTVTIQELLQYTNEERAKNGLPPLTLNTELNNAAAGKAQDMIVKNYWAHTSPDGVTPWAFIKGAGYDYVYAGENLARGFTSSRDIVSAWMNSPGHRENMVSGNFKDVGFAIITGTLTGDETVLVVQEFGSRQMVASNQTVNVPVIPTATPVVVAQVLPTATPTPVPPTPTATIVPTVVTPPVSELRVAAERSTPLIDKLALSRQVVIGIGFMFLGVLLLDVIIIERKKIVRMLAHNIDHIIFLSVIMLAILSVGKGLVL